MEQEITVTASITNSIGTVESSPVKKFKAKLDECTVDTISPTSLSSYSFLY